MGAVPGDAAAVDVPCPHCGERPIQQAAKNYRLAGFLLAFQIKSDVQIGCATCTRRKSWKSAAITAVTGWWSVTCALLNPFAIAWNLGRGLLNRGPSSGLVDVLEESGVEVSFLDDPADYDASGHRADEPLVRGLATLGCAVMLADDDADRAEATLIREELEGLSPEFGGEDLEALITETARSAPTAEDVGGALGRLLTDEGREAALGLATRVAAADGEVDEEEVALIGAVADELGIEVDEEAIEALIELGTTAGEDGVEGTAGAVA